MADPGPNGQGMDWGLKFAILMIVLALVIGFFTEGLGRRMIDALK